MAKKTLYMVLGVPDNETPKRIHAAYRDLAKRLHPDVAGDGATRAFQEVAEAYAVLSDPGARLAYDRGLAMAERAGADASSVAGPVASRGRPMVGVQRATPPPLSPEGLHLEVWLDDDDLLLGCVVPIELPAVVACPQCRDRRRDWLVGCGYCAQRGLVETREVLRVRIPPLTPSGTRLEVVLPDGRRRGDFVVQLHIFHQGGVG